jgi:AAA domain
MTYNRVEVFDFTKDAQLPKVPPPFLVEGMLHRSQTIIYGQTNAGKSMLALSLAAAVAGGQSWCGRTVSSAGTVAIVSGDPDGLYENCERLDKVRDDIGGGQIRLIVPQRPMARETWFEVEQLTEGCSLLVLDNLTQFVPGSLNDDNAVKLVYEQLQQLQRRGTSVCVLAHTSDKRNEHGYSSDIPLGSTIIRTVPRWFVSLKRAQGALSLSMSGNSGGRPWEMKLTEPTDTPRFSVIDMTTADELAERRQQRQRRRDTATLDENARIKAWLAANPGVPQREAAERMTGELGFKVSQTRVSQVNRMDFSPALIRDS